MTNATPLLFHVHIMKTGGTTVRNSIIEALGEQQYRDLRPQSLEGYFPLLYRFHDKSRKSLLSIKDNAIEEFRRLTRKDNKSFLTVRSAGGHVAIYHAPKIKRTVKAVALIRDPIERMASMYYSTNRMLKTSSTVPRTAWRRAYLADSFEQFAQYRIDNIDKWPLCQQCRYLSRSGTSDEAIHNINSGAISIGVTECMPDFIIKIENYLEINMDRSRHDNKMNSRPPIENLSKPMLRDLKIACAEDLRLYEFALKRVF